jgi:hypothetical protein
MKQRPKTHPLAQQENMSEWTYGGRYRVDPFSPSIAYDPVSW